jgi:hypothetical protein
MTPAQPVHPRPKRYRRPVIGPDGTLYASLVDAATAVRVYPATITLWCAMRRNGWRFAADAEAPPASPAA